MQVHKLATGGKIWPTSGLCRMEWVFANNNVSERMCVWICSHGGILGILRFQDLLLKISFI